MSKRSGTYLGGSTVTGPTGWSSIDPASSRTKYKSPPQKREDTRHHLYPKSATELAEDRALLRLGTTELITNEQLAERGMKPIRKKAKNAKRP
jgi:hypothetical protein